MDTCGTPRRGVLVPKTSTLRDHAKPGTSLMSRNQAEGTTLYKIPGPRHSGKDRSTERERKAGKWPGSGKGAKNKQRTEDWQATGPLGTVLLWWRHVFTHLPRLPVPRMTPV